MVTKERIKLRLMLDKPEDACLAKTRLGGILERCLSALDLSVSIFPVLDTYILKYSKIFSNILRVFYKNF